MVAAVAPRLFRPPPWTTPVLPPSAAVQFHVVRRAIRELPHRDPRRLEYHPPLPNVAHFAMSRTSPPTPAVLAVGASFLLALVAAGCGARKRHRSRRLQRHARYQYFEGAFRSVGDVGPGRPLRVGTAPGVQLRGDERSEYYGVRLSGLLHIPDDALYTFDLSSDDRAELRISGKVIAGSAGGTGQGQIALRKGFHPLDVVFFQATGSAALRLEVSIPGSVKRIVPPEWFAHEGAR
jgi:PA14 domain-containing protein